MIKIIKTRFVDSKQRQSTFTASVLGTEIKTATDHHEQVVFRNGKMPKQILRYYGQIQRKRGTPPIINSVVV